MIAAPFHHTSTYSETPGSENNQPQWPNADSFGEDFTHLHGSGKLTTKISTFEVSGDSSGEDESPHPERNALSPYPPPFEKLPVELLGTFPDP